LRDKGEAPQIARLSMASCREALSRVARWRQWDSRKSDWKQRRPPNFVAEDLLARGQWSHVRRLISVVETPVLRADGTVLTKPGMRVRLSTERSCDLA